jgi:hypothetical protein
MTTTSPSTATRSWQTLVIKSLAFWIGFLILHFAHSWLPVEPVRWISGTDESFYQHQKIAFFVYLAVNLAECGILWRQSTDRTALMWSRLFTVVLMPWVIFLLWYTSAAYYGRFESLASEVIFANMITLIAPACCMVVERQLERASPSLAFKVLTTILLLIALSEFVIFTYRLPWADVFVEPLLEH